MNNCEIIYVLFKLWYSAAMTQWSKFVAAFNLFGVRHTSIYHIAITDKVRVA